MRTEQCKQLYHVHFQKGVFFFSGKLNCLVVIVQLHYLGTILTLLNGQVKHLHQCSIYWVTLSMSEAL